MSAIVRVRDNKGVVHDIPAIVGPKGDTGATGPQGAPGTDAPQIDDTAVNATNPWSSEKIVGDVDSVIDAFGLSSAIDSWKNVPKIIRNGFGPKVLPVGSRLTVAHSEYGSIALDVAAHNHHKKPGDPDAPTMTLLMHHCIYGRQIDASELLWANTGDSALAAGTYNFTLYKGSNGGQTYLEPQGSATREQVATILMNFCQNVKK